MANDGQPTVSDINDETDTAIHVLDLKIVDTIAAKNQATGDTYDQLSQTVDQFMGQRSDMYGLDFEQAIEGADMAAALAVIKGATEKMTTVASIMVGVTAIINKANDFLSAGGTIITTVNKIKKA
jgi:hypothetical protein